MTGPILVTMNHSKRWRALMNDTIHAHAGRNRRAPVKESQPPEVAVPEEAHPCFGCPMRDQNINVPYCFLPVCMRDNILKGSRNLHEI